MNDLLISVATYNRFPIARFFLDNINLVRRNSTLHIYDDCSDSIDLNFLEKNSNHLIVNSKNIGVHKTKWKQFRNFLNSNFKYLYITDSDSLHDPNFLSVLESLPKDNPISLYTSHVNGDVDCDKYFFRKYSGGISHFYTREMVEKIVFYLDKHGEPNSGWDYKAIDFIGKPMLVTKTSYVEHLGYGGLHSGKSWNHDKAKNPTPFLVSQRQKAIEGLRREYENLF